MSGRQSKRIALELILDGNLPRCRRLRQPDVVARKVCGFILDARRLVPDRFCYRIAEQFWFFHDDIFSLKLISQRDGLLERRTRNRVTPVMVKLRWKSKGVFLRRNHERRSFIDRELLCAKLIGGGKRARRW